MAIEMEPYWLVHGNGPAHHKHPTERSAVAEADRLARAYPGQVFVVLEAITAVRKVDVERVSFRPERERIERDPRHSDDIPF